MRVEYGVDQPKYVQYARWMRKVSQGDFGVSLEYQRPVMEVIRNRIWLTIVVSLAAVLFTWVLALPIGIYSAVRQYSLADYIFTFVGFLGLAVPGFLFGFVVLYIGFAFFNANIGGLFSPEYAEAPWNGSKVLDLTKHLLVPAVVLGTAAMAQAIRIMRANLLDELRKPYVVTARAKGLTEMRVILLSFLGLGLRPPAISWGVLLQEAQNVQTLAISPWLLLPAVPVIIIILVFNFLGDGLRDAADPYGV